MTALTFHVEPAFTLEAVEQPMSWAELVARHDELVDGHHHVDAYWFPHTDRCQVKTGDRTLEPPAPLPRVRAYLEDGRPAATAPGRSPG
jgi:L-gulono-1,4-lactone dehydrogenase